MKIRVLFFGSTRDITGTAEEQIDFENGSALGELRRQYESRFPRLAEMSGSLLIAVNEEFRERSWHLNDGDEVAFIPPVSGGSETAAMTAAMLESLSL